MGSGGVTARVRMKHTLKELSMFRVDFVLRYVYFYVNSDVYVRFVYGVSIPCGCS